MDTNTFIELYQARISAFRLAYGSEAACMASPHFFYMHPITPHGRGKPKEDLLEPPSVWTEPPPHGCEGIFLHTNQRRKGYPFLSICTARSYTSVWDDLEITETLPGADISSVDGFTSYRDHALDGPMTASLQIIFYDYARAIIGTSRVFSHKDVINLIMEMAKRTKEAITC